MRPKMEKKSKIGKEHQAIPQNSKENNDIKEDISNDDVEEHASNDDEEITNDDTELSPKAKKYRLILTALLLLLSYQAGFEVGLIGPSLMDMKEKYHTDYEQLGRAMMWRPLAAIPGAYLGGIVCDYCRSRLCIYLGIFLVVNGVINMCLPFGGSMTILTIMYLIQGFSHSTTVVGADGLIIVLWRKKVTIPLHLKLAFKNVAYIFAGLLVRPFLTPINNNGSLNSNITTTLPEYKMENQIHIPYLIIGSFGILVSVPFFIITFFNAPDELNILTRMKPKPMKRKWSLESFKQNIGVYLILMTVAIFICYMASAVSEVTLSNYLLSIAVESELHFTKSTAAILHTTYYFGRFVGRLLYGFIASFLGLKTATGLAVCLFITFGALMCFAGLYSEIVMWISVPLYAFFNGPMTPLIVSFVNLFVPVKGILLAIFYTGSTLGAMISLLVGGTIFEHNGPWTLLFFTFNMSLVLGLSVFVANLLGRKHKQKISGAQDYNNSEKEPLMK